MIKSTTKSRPVLTRKVKKTASRCLLTLLALPAGMLFLAPLLWMLSTSLKDPRFVFLYPPQLIPDPVRWDNYYKALTNMPFHLYAWNTIQITVLCLIGHLLTASLVAYGFGRLRFPGRDFLFIVLLSTMMLPTQVTLIPTFVIFRYLGWVDTFMPMIVPDWLGGVPFTVFMLRQFITTVPLDLDDAAKIEGCGYFDIYRYIILPMIKPALAMVAVFVFFWNWNDFYYPVIYINSREKWTLNLALNFMKRLDPYGWAFQYVELIMAASVVVMLPCLLVYFLAQKYFMQGIVFTGVKG